MESKIGVSSYLKNTVLRLSLIVSINIKCGGTHNKLSREENDTCLGFQCFPYNNHTRTYDRRQYRRSQLWMQQRVTNCNTKLQTLTNEYNYKLNFQY